MPNRFLIAVLLLPASVLMAQEGSGFTVPATLTAGALYTHRLQTEDPQASPFAPAIRALVSPQVQFGNHWLAAATVHVSSTPFFPFQAYDAERTLFARVIQAYVGYRYSSGKSAFTVKAGKLASAFGSFPLRYEDDQNALIDAPVGYGASEYGPLEYPVTLYGLPGVQVTATIRKVDARFQFTNSSPANPARLFGGGQNSNWTVGAGYTIVQGLRVGASFYRGGYLMTGPYLLSTERSGDWPATAVGVDAQWRTGHWTFMGEWNRFQFPYPRFKVNPELTTSYIEVKRTLLPRVYVAARFGKMPHGVLQANFMPSPAAYPPGRKTAEAVVGFRISRAQLIKIGYEASAKDGVRGTLDNVFAIQLVTTLPTLSRTF